jgi:hypothetical protein
MITVTATSSRQCRVVGALIACGPCTRQMSCRTSAERSSFPSRIKQDQAAPHPVSVPLDPLWSRRNMAQARHGDFQAPLFRLDGILGRA